MVIIFYPKGLMFAAVVFLFLLLLGGFDLAILIMIAKGAFGVGFLLVTQLTSFLIGLFFFFRHKLDFNLIFFIDIELKKRTKIVKELWGEAILLTSVLLLFTPGVFSDFLGFLGLIPQLRELMVDQLDVKSDKF